LLLSACVTGPVERPLSVREIVENAEALDGQEIVVSGWLDRCDRLSCVIYSSANEVGKDWAYFLSIGPSPWFDAFAKRAAPGRIILRARFKDRCVSDPATQTIELCTDRATTLEAISLVR
jgi:hypothetical protein